MSIYWTGTTLHPSKLVGGPGSLISLHMIDPTTGWALSEHAVLRTADGGFHWKNVTPPNTLLTRESIADFLTANLAWVTTPQANGATTQVLRTMDSGQTWQQSTIPAAYVKQMTFFDAQRGWILAGWGGPEEERLRQLRCTVLVMAERPGGTCPGRFLLRRIHAPLFIFHSEG